MITFYLVIIVHLYIFTFGQINLKVKQAGNILLI